MWWTMCIDGKIFSVLDVPMFSSLEHLLIKNHFEVMVNGVHKIRSNERD